MCGSDDPYNAYSSGDFSRWEAQFKRASEIRQAEARGEISPEEAQAQLARINLGGLENTIKQDAAANMELRELKRQGDVDIGKINIDQAFKKFGDQYFNDYKTAYSENYMPELDRQHTAAVGKTTASLADRGMLESSTGINKFADLQRQRDAAAAGIANDASNASKTLKGQVENAKSSLYSLNQASADPKAINAQAIGQATSLVAPPTYSPMGEVFANYINNLSTYQTAKQNAPGPRYQSPYGSSSGQGSATVVR